MAACNPKNSTPPVGDDLSDSSQSDESSLKSCQDAYSWDWQSTKNQLKEGFEFVLTNELFCDVYFLVGSEPNIKKMGAHKLVLSVRSSVFLSMFIENLSSDCSEIEVTDVEADAFAEMLRFIYSDNIELTAETVTSIMYAAKKFAILPLENKCADFFLNVLCPGNAFNFLSWARMFNVRKLVDACFKLIADETIETLKADDFCNIDSETLCLILKSNDLKISEISLFDAVIRWSKAACKKKNLPISPENQRSVLKDALLLLRFPIMAPDDFASKVLDSGILSQSEIIPVFMYFNKNSKHNTSIFSDIPRSEALKESKAESAKEKKTRKASDSSLKEGVKDNHKLKTSKASNTSLKESPKKNPGRKTLVPESSFFVAQRFQKYKKGNYGGDLTNLEIRFSVNRDVRLMGFGLYGSVSPSDYTIEAKLSEVDAKAKFECEKSWSFSDSKSLLKLMFVEPAQLFQFHYYTLKVKMQGVYDRSGIDGLQTLKVPISAEEWVTFHFHKPPGLRNNVVLYGQIPELYFKI